MREDSWRGLFQECWLFICAYLMVVCCSTVVSERLSPERREREVWLLSCFAQSGALWAAVVNWSRAGRQELHY